MEFVLLGVLARIGLGFILIATLVLLAMHVVENQKSGSNSGRTGRRPVDANAFRLHRLPAVKPAEAAEPIEQTTQRAA